MPEVYATIRTYTAASPPPIVDGRWSLAVQNNQRVALTIMFSSFFPIATLSINGAAGDQSGFNIQTGPQVQGVYRERDGMLPTFAWTMDGTIPWVSDATVIEQISTVPLAPAFATTMTYAATGPANPLVQEITNGERFTPSVGDLGPVPISDTFRSVPGQPETSIEPLPPINRPSVLQPIDNPDRPNIGQPIAIPPVGYLDRLTGDLRRLLDRINNARKRKCDDAKADEVASILQDSHSEYGISDSPE